MYRRKKRKTSSRTGKGTRRVPAQDGPTLSDPYEMALAITLLNILGKAVEAAGAVRDLVHQHITEDQRAALITRRLYETTVDHAPIVPQNVWESFHGAFQVARTRPIPGVRKTREILQKELDTTIPSIARMGVEHTVAEAFAGVFQDRAGVAIRTRNQVPPKDSVKFPQSRVAFMLQASRQLFWRSQQDLVTLARICQKTDSAYRSDKGLDAVKEDVFQQACDAARHRMEDEAATPDPTFALCIAAAAVMTSSIDEYGIRKYLRSHAMGDCTQMARAMSDASGISPKRAVLILDAMLEGARMYRNSTIESAGEAAVRAIRTAHMWVSLRAATVVFRGVYGLAVGAAWTASPDRDRFESAYGRALETAARMDPDIQFVFDTLIDLSDPESDDAHLAQWDFFYGASGHTLARWAEVAREVDYRSVALLPENAPIMEAYRAYYDRSLAIATRIASDEKRAAR